MYPVGGLALSLKQSGANGATGSLLIFHLYHGENKLHSMKWWWILIAVPIIIHYIAIGCSSEWVNIVYHQLSNDSVVLCICCFSTKHVAFKE
jgi:hypothetical protein